MYTGVFIKPQTVTKLRTSGPLRHGSVASSKVHSTCRACVLFAYSFLLLLGKIQKLINIGLFIIYIYIIWDCWFVVCIQRHFSLATH